MESTASNVFRRIEQSAVELSGFVGKADNPISSKAFVSRGAYVLIIALVSTATVACGGGGSPTENATEIASQIKQTLPERLEEQGVSVASAEVSCVQGNSDATSFKCFADVVEKDTYTSERLLINVTCQPGGGGCIWETNP